MTCTKQTAELVECARRRTEPDRNLRTHLAGCSRCAERWESERRLTDELSKVWFRATALMADDTQREVLMRDFVSLSLAQRELAERRQRNAVGSWALALGAAAAVVVFVAAGFVAAKRMNPPAARAIPAHEVRSAQSIYYETGYDEPSTDAGALSGDDFIAVPYTPPLAQGELVRVVHADLYPETLASMGIDVDPSEASEIPADVVVGEDGIPRAVRIIGSAQ